VDLNPRPLGYEPMGEGKDMVPETPPSEIRLDGDSSLLCPVPNWNMLIHL